MQIVYEVIKADGYSAKVRMFVNGALATNREGLSLRVSELTEFMIRTDPEHIYVDGAAVSSEAIFCLKKFKQTELF